MRDKSTSCRGEKFKIKDLIITSPCSLLWSFFLRQSFFGNCYHWLIVQSVAACLRKSQSQIWTRHVDLGYPPLTDNSAPVVFTCFLASESLHCNPVSQHTVHQAQPQIFAVSLGCASPWSPFPVNHLLNLNLCIRHLVHSQNIRL